MALETVMKAWCRILLFVIGRETRAAASMIEAAQYIAERRRVVLVINDIEAGTVIHLNSVSVSEATDLNRARRFLADISRQYGVHVFGSVVDACRHIERVLHAHLYSPHRQNKPHATGHSSTSMHSRVSDVSLTRAPKKTQMIPF